MRLTQGTFSFLPDLTDEQIASQINYCLLKGWSIGIEYTDDPHPRNAYWEMWKSLMFDMMEPSGIMAEIVACRHAFPDHYVKVNANDSKRGRESVALSFLVNRPKHEPGFRLNRQEVGGRAIRYTIHSYAADRPEGQRYAVTAAASEGTGADAD
jgi:ribulose-bisphosphate carboxylase small chain